MNEKLKNFADSISPLIFLDLMFESRKNATRMLIYFVISIGLIITVFFMQLSYSDLSRAGIVNAFFIIICACSALIGGTYSAASITSEKEKKTLTLLRMSGISGLQIITGKIISGFIYMLVLSLPYIVLTLMITVFGDFNFFRLAGGFFMWAGFTFFYLASGVLISILFKKNASANSFFYFSMFALHFLIFLLDEWFYRPLYDYNSYKFFTNLSPIDVWVNYSSSHIYGSAYYGNDGLSSIFGNAVPDYAVITLLYILFSIILTLFAANIFEKYLRWRED